MRLMRVLTVLTLAVGILLTSPQARAAGTPPLSGTTVVQKFYTQLVETMKQGDQLGFSGRYKKMDPAVREAFNLSLMARFAVGPAWASASTDEQKKLVEAFSAFSIATYASRFKKYDGEAFEVLGEKPAAQGGVIVETKLTPKGGDSVTLNYLVRADEKGAPRICDVYLDAAISELATRRSEFTAIVKREGFGALVQSLEAKSKKMGT